MRDSAMVSVGMVEKELTDALGIGVRDIAPIHGGGNNRIYRVTAADGRRYAVKAYWRDTQDVRDRLGTEFQSLQFMWQHGLRCVPEPVFCDRGGGFAVYEYLDGTKADCHRIAAQDIEQVADFLGQLRRLSRQPRAQTLLPASDACFSVGDVARSVAHRLERLGEVAHRELVVFLEAALQPYFETATTEAGVWLARQGGGMEDTLSTDLRTLSPSDYGFHNALRRPDGRLVFVDFEYFGWDDPAKMTADFLLHPAMTLTTAQKQQFLRRMSALFGAWLRERLRVVYPLHGAAWCARLLNEFVPEHARRREFAAHGADTSAARRTAQLQKAKHKLEQVRQDYLEIVA